MVVTTRRRFLRPVTLTASVCLPLLGWSSMGVRPSNAAGSLTAVTPEPTAPFGILDAAAAQDQLVAAINALRSNHGLSPLELDAALAELALERSMDMAQRGYFSHEIPGTGDATVWALGELPDALEVAENLGRSNAPESAVITAIFDAWIASPGHLRNFLKPHFNRVGIGTVQMPGPGETTTTVITELFAASPVPLRRTRNA